MSTDTHRARFKVRPSFRWLSVLLVTALLSGPATALSVAQKKEIARTQFENAERMREALNGRPAHDRKARDYQRVIDAYRRVYYLSPTSTKADASAMAVAELLVEQGRLLKSDDILKAAVTQYEFLRREYPGSKYRVEALFTIAQIYKDDLNDKDNAKATLQEFVKRYPHSQQFEEARQALKELDEPPVQEAKKRKTKPEAKIADTKPLPSKKVVEPDDPETAAQEDETAAAKEPLKQVADAAE